ncbi:baseplate J/gp47 family protein [Pseudomonas sp. F(2018)]|uniref:baseplate J/gp47 family protein n=1 Tax=Pseudomonas sp. F(2018) TaxID=2502240 RepID=UPI0010F81104|nr:baseplate J/gp47 family protein [Pseudomonas sp. F(2018)]
MAFEIPSLAETRELTATDMQTWLPGTSATTRRTAVGVIAYAQAGVEQGLHAHVEYRARNFLPDEQADAEGVERWARGYGLWYLDPAYARGPAIATGSLGAPLDAGTRMQSKAGVIFILQEHLVLGAEGGEALVQAEEPGAAGNLPAGAVLTLLSPVPGVQANLVVGAAGIAGGADTEQLQGLLARVQDRMRNPPKAGHLDDYVTWAKAAHPSVTRAWSTEHEQGVGSVTVRIVCDNEVTPIPTAPVLEAAAAYIDNRRPAGRRSVYVLPPVAEPITYDIRLSPDSAAIRAAVEAELRDLHRREAVPGGTLLLTHIREAISTAPGEHDHQLLAPVANVVTTTGKLAVFGGITWA